MKKTLSLILALVMLLGMLPQMTLIAKAEAAYDSTNGRLQQLPEDICCDTNLWVLLDPVNEYYTATGWGNSSKSVYSVTFPVTAGDRICATSFRAAGENGFSENGVRITWFSDTGVLESLHRDTVYAEFAANGYITVPEGAVAVNIPMIDNADMWEIYIQNREHCYENGSCNACGAPKWDTDGDGTLEILAIGNSFSVDALQYAYQIAQDLGIEKIAIGNLYIGGCTLATHAANAAGDLGKYTYYYNDSGTWKTTSNYKISTALESRSWDYVSLQQASNYSGVESTYNEDLTNLIAYVQERSDAKLVWHMTWAYQQNSTHSAFPTYNKDQMTMYNAIVSAVQNKIVTNSQFDLIVPNGTAVQNSRTSLLGDTTTRDGYHMSYDYGRYLTGLLFIKTVTGLSVDNVTYAPSGVDAEEKAIAIESVNNAAAKPFEVTNSAYVEVEPEIPDEGYILLKPELHKGAYWYPTDAKNYNIPVADASNSKYYFATVRFTREDLPVGSIIVLEEGWQYRPDGWITDAVQSSRANTTTESFVTVTEEWWGNYTLRGFNIAKVGTPSLMDLSAEDIYKAFRIYVPEASHIHKNENCVCIYCGYRCLADVKSWGMTLKEDLSVKFKVNVREDIRNTAKILITVDGNTVSYDLSQYSAAPDDDCYEVSAAVSAAQMGHPIQIQVVNGEETEALQIYTVKEYARRILEDPDMEAYHPLVREMLNYGAASQVYFKYNTDSLVSDIISDTSGVGKEDIPAAEDTKVSGKISGVSFRGATLLLKNKLGIRYYFTVSGDVAGLTFTANGNAYTPVAKDGMYYVEIADILPQNLDQQITLTVTDANGSTLTVTYGPMNYIVRMNEKGSAELKNLIKALYNYHLAAKALA